MPCILVVEDDPPSRELTMARLRPYYDVRCASCGEDALEVVSRHHVDLAIVDVMMPGMDGYELARAMHLVNQRLPILMLTALDSFDAKRDGYGAGTDDYLVKPVAHEELLWHVRALLRRAEINQSNRVQVGSCVLDASSYTMAFDATGDSEGATDPTPNDAKSDAAGCVPGGIVDGTLGSAAASRISLTLPKKEFDILFLLMSYPGTVFTKDQILSRVWGLHSAEDEATLKTHISRLRSRLVRCRDFSIVNMRGLGYKVVAIGGEA